MLDGPRRRIFHPESRKTTSSEIECLGSNNQIATFLQRQIATRKRMQDPRRRQLTRKPIALDSLVSSRRRWFDHTIKVELKSGLAHARRPDRVHVIIIDI